jgi:hypothetical protein
VAPGDQGNFPKGTLILVDELATCDPRDLNVGLHWPPSKLAEAISEMARRWGMRSVHGVSDDASGLDDSLLNVLRQHGLFFQRAQKQRIAGGRPCGRC